VQGEGGEEKEKEKRVVGWGERGKNKRGGRARK